MAGQVWSQQYNTHPVVRAAGPGETVWPLGLFCDKVPFTQRDQALVFYVYNLVSGQRHLNIALRTSEMCGCGCQGWCTV